jgi:signal peptidase I
MKQNHLFINGRSLIYNKTHSSSDLGDSGKVLEFETGYGWDIYISYTPNTGDISSFDEIIVPPKNYFVLGSNRDMSEDSRHYGPISRDRILGKVILKF